jgi:hypothetical protein
MRVLRRQDLPQKGIPYSAAHIRRLVNQGAFPRPIKLGTGTRLSHGQSPSNIARSDLRNGRGRNRG